ncbi:MAG: hypothetical protein ACFFAO_11855 [Candidatus Hermodarchaeota archaeon]
MGYVFIKRRDLLYLFLTYVILAIGVVISAITNITKSEGPGHLISRIFYIVSTLTILIGVFREYYETFLQEKIDKSKISPFIMSSVLINTVIIVLILEVAIIILCGICAAMSIKISLKKHTFTHAFLSLSMITVLLALIITIMRTIGVEGVVLYYYGINLIFFTTLLITAIAALLDKKITITSFEKYELKKKYSHELINILRAISMYYDKSKLYDKSLNKLQDQDTIIEDKIDEASDIIKYIRDL